MAPPPTEATAGLAALARGGDLQAFSRLIEAEQARLMGQALAFCGDPHTAQDLVQETMVEAWKSLARYDGSCRFFTWLYVILLRRHRQSLRWFSRRLPLPTAEQIVSGARYQPAVVSDAEAVESAESELLRGMVAELPARHREVIRLRFYAEASEVEIAAALGISPGTVKSRLHHAMEKLRRMKEKMNRLRGSNH